MKRTKILKCAAYIVMTMAVTVAAIALTTAPAKCDLIEAQRQEMRMIELMEQGYTPEQAFDQMTEEFSGVDGIFGTGGIDGQRISGGTGNSSQAAQPETPAPACTHEWREQTNREATCAQKGEKVKTCTLCGESTTSSIPKKEHIYQKTDATYGNCVEIGSVTYICEVCGDSYTEETSTGEHVFMKTDVCEESTCCSEGKTEELCQYCGEKRVETIPTVPCKAAETGQRTQEPTCTKEGELSYHCVWCGNVAKTEPVPAKGHTRPQTHEVTQAPTLFKEGAARYCCTECGEVLEEVVLPKKSFPWQMAAVAGGIVVMMTAIVILTVKVSKRKK